MFPSFTGSAKPRRQVNLSGRNTNPFATISGSRQPPSSQIAQNALAHAQQERLIRKQERERPPAATAIQRTWRGHKAREEARSRWRQEWDCREEKDLGSSHGVFGSEPPSTAYRSEDDCLNQLRLLVQFASATVQDDIRRLRHFGVRYLSSLDRLPSTRPADIWTYPLLRLAKITMATLKQSKTSSLPSNTVNNLLGLLSAIVAAIPKQLAPYSLQYYQALAVLVTHTSVQSYDRRLLWSAIEGLLQPITPRTTIAYEGFISEFLVISDLPAILGSLKFLVSGLDYKLLATALNALLYPPSGHGMLQFKSHEELLWLLAYFTYFRRRSHTSQAQTADAPDALYINAISKLISYLADDIKTRIDLSKDLSLEDGDTSETTRNTTLPLPSFVRDEILTLVNKESVSSLLAHLEIAPESIDNVSEASSQASSLASYALTLLRAFPYRGDEIRLWLYLGSTSKHSGNNLPAIKYFYQAASATKVYGLIKHDPREAISLLKTGSVGKPSQRSTSQISSESKDQQWRVILLFLELYTFVLKVMDDEEFLSGGGSSDKSTSWTRQSALPLDQVKDLTLFLKNLAFSMYWNAGEIAGIEVSETKNSIAEYFSGNSGTSLESRQDVPATKPDGVVIAGVTGMTLNYIKGIVTGLLRMVYERE